MFARFFRYYLYPIAALAGSVIGVGFLALPYITVKVGALVMAVYFVAITALVVFANLLFVEVALKTPDHKRFPGFAHYHLGIWAKYLALVVGIAGGWGVLLIYLVASAEFLQGLLSLSPQATTWATVLFFAASAGLSYSGIRAIARVEFWVLCLLGISFTMVLGHGVAHFRFANIPMLPSQPDWKVLLLPYGALIFSLGTYFIPVVEEMVRGHKQSLKKIVTIGTLIPAAIYIIFSFLVVGITGGATTQSALAGLSVILGGQITSMAIASALVILCIAFVASAVYLKEVFVYDMKIKPFYAWLLACFVPLVLLFFVRNSFVVLISFTGSVFSGIAFALEMAMYRKIGGNRIIAYGMTALFLAGVACAMILF